MAHPSFLLTFARHRDPKLLWPVAAVASVAAHGLALVMIRTLAIQTPTLPEGEMAPLPIQMVTLPLDPALPTDGAPSQPGALAAEPAPAVDAPTPMAAQTTPQNNVAAPQTLEPAIAPDPLPQPVAPAPIAPAPIAPDPLPQPVAPAPIAPAPIAPAPPAVTPAPPRPASPVSPPVAPPPSVSPPPGRDPSLGGGSPPALPPPGAGIPNAGGGSGQGGQVVPLGIRLDPSGRDIPDQAPQLLRAPAMAVQPLASGCGFANLDALMAGRISTSVQLQIRVEPSGEISHVNLVQGTGNSAVDDLVSCVVRQRLRLQPASSAGVPQLTDAFILDARVEF